MEKVEDSTDPGPDQDEADPSSAPSDHHGRGRRGRGRKFGGPRLPNPAAAVPISTLLTEPPFISTQEDHTQLKVLKDDKDHVSTFIKGNAGSVENIRCRGSWRSIIDAYESLLPRTRCWVDMSGLGRFLSINNICNGDTTVVSALIERWWDTTHTFHLPNVEVGITPLDFTMLTGISIGVGRPLDFDEGLESFDAACALLPDITHSDFQTDKCVKFVHLASYFKKRPGDTDKDEQDHQVIARAFLMYFLGQVAFPSAHSYIRLGYLACFRDMTKVGDYDWGGAILCYLYCGLDAISRGRDRTNFSGFAPLLQMFFYEYFTVMNPTFHSVDDDIWPRMARWSEDRRVHIRGRLRGNTPPPRSQLESKTFSSVVWRPWLNSRAMDEQCVHTALNLSRTRMVLACPGMHAWYLGDRCWMQVMGVLTIPRDPPPDMPRSRPGLIYSDAHMEHFADGGWFDATPYLFDQVDYQVWFAYWRRVSIGSHLGVAGQVTNSDIVGDATVTDLIEIPHPPQPSHTPGPYNTPLQNSLKQHDVRLLDPFVRCYAVGDRPALLSIPVVEESKMVGMPNTIDWTLRDWKTHYMGSLRLIAGLRDSLLSSSTEYGKLYEEADTRVRIAEGEVRRLQQQLGTTEMNHSQPSQPIGEYEHSLTTIGNHDACQTEECVNLDAQGFTSKSSSERKKRPVIRGKGYTSQEDEVLVKAWLEVSQDSENLSSGKFYDRVRCEFNKNVEESRWRYSTSSIQTRWGGISRAVSHFIGCIAQVENRDSSGIVTDTIEESKKLYQQTVKDNKPFIHEGCWHILKKHPKWQILKDSISTPVTPTTPTTPISDADGTLGINKRENRPEECTKELDKRLKKAVPDDKFELFKAQHDEVVDLVKGMEDAAYRAQMVWQQDIDERKEQRLLEAQERAKYDEEKRIREVLKRDVASKQLEVLTMEVERQKRLDREAERKEDERILGMDLSNMDDIAKSYWENKKREAIARLTGKGTESGN